MRLVLVFALPLLLLVLSACAAAPTALPPSPRQEEGAVAVVLRGETMGSTWHVSIVVPAGRADAARAMKAPIDAALERINAEMSTWRADSEISRFNAHASTEPFPVSAETALVVARALEIGRATDGAFDITLDPLIALWGFDRQGRRDAPPSEAEIDAARAHVGLGLVAVEGNALVKRDPAVTINLGGIASGFAVDVVSTLLGDHGFGDFMVEVTGEVRAQGRSAAGSPWRIGVQVPDDESGDVIGAIELEGREGRERRALTTSGSYRNSFVSGGRRYSHILDPRTGAPVMTSLVSVTVLGPDALTADGYDTPLLILGEERARALLAKKPGMEALFIHANDDGTFRVTTTPGFPALTR